MVLILSEYWLWAYWCPLFARWNTYMIFNHNNTLRVCVGALLLFSFYKWETWRSKWHVSCSSLPLSPWVLASCCDSRAKAQHGSSQGTKYPICLGLSHLFWCHLYHTYIWLKTCLKYLAHSVSFYLSVLITTASLELVQAAGAGT